MSKRFFLLFALVASLFFATVTRSAHAAESAPAAVDPKNHWEARPFALLGQVGFGTPTGMLGVHAEWSPSSWATISTGIGLAIDGPQVALMPRLRVPVSQGFGISFGAGLSAGKYQIKDCWWDCTEATVYTKNWDIALWGNLEFGVEGRLAGGFTWRTFVGYGGILNGSDSKCSVRLPRSDYGYSTPSTSGPGCGGNSDQPTIGYLGAAFGYAF